MLVKLPIVEETIQKMKTIEQVFDEASDNGIVFSDDLLEELAGAMQDADMLVKHIAELVSAYKQKKNK